MSLFSSDDCYLGVDFCSTSVKVVELKSAAGRPRLVTYGFFDQDLNLLSAGNEDKIFERLPALIKAVCKKAKVTTRQAVASLPAFSVFNSILNLPLMPRKELILAIESQARKVVPLPLEEMILDWKILESPTKANQPKSSKNFQVQESTVESNGEDLNEKNFLEIESPEKEYQKILLTATAKELVKKYIDIFRAANLNLLGLDAEYFALIRSLVGNDKSALIIVDFGSTITSVIVIAAGIPVLIRSIKVGGLAITQAIAKNLNVDLNYAEQFKRDFSLSANKEVKNNLPQITESVLTPIIDEIRYSHNLYKNQGRKNIEKIILTGGSSLLLNFTDYLSNSLGLKVFIGNPWARIIQPPDLKPVLDQIGPRFSVAIGLAMREIE